MLITDPYSHDGQPLPFPLMQRCILNSSLPRPFPSPPTYREDLTAATFDLRRLQHQPSE